MRFWRRQSPKFVYWVERYVLVYRPVRYQRLFHTKTTTLAHGQTASHTILPENKAFQNGYGYSRKLPALINLSLQMPLLIQQILQPQMGRIHLRPCLRRLRAPRLRDRVRCSMHALQARDERGGADAKEGRVGGGRRGDEVLERADGVGCGGVGVHRE